VAIASLFQPDNHAEKLAVRRGSVAERERYNEAHSDDVVRHARHKEQPILRKINHFADILDVDESRVKWANVQGQRQP
jgi:hypothetical protein